MILAALVANTGIAAWVIDLAGVVVLRAAAALRARRDGRGSAEAVATTRSA